MKLTKTQLRKIIREELLNEEQSDITVILKLKMSDVSKPAERKWFTEQLKDEIEDGWDAKVKSIKIK